MEEKIKPWEQPNTPWKTESAFLTYIRGGIRRGIWNKHPLKLKFIKLERERIPNPNPNGRTAEVWGGRCSLCDGLFAQKDLEVDHKEGNHSLRSVSDIQSFVEATCFVTYDDLQIVCKPCHKIKSMADSRGISFEEAKIEKLAIEVCKLKKEAFVAWLRDIGYDGPIPKTKDKREFVREVLNEHNKHDDS